MQWFTWFFGSQVVLLWANKREWLEGEDMSRYVATAWLIYNASGVVVAILVANYTWRQRHVLDKIGFPIREASISALLNALALGGTCVLWWRIASR